MRLRYGTALNKKDLSDALIGLVPLGMSIPLITRMEAQRTLWRIFQNPQTRRWLRIGLEKVPKKLLQEIQKVVPFGEDILKSKAYLDAVGKKGAYFQKLSPYRPELLETAKKLPGSVGKLFVTLEKGPIIGLGKSSRPETFFRELGRHIFRTQLNMLEKGKIFKEFDSIGEFYVRLLEKITKNPIANHEDLFSQAVAEYFYNRGAFKKFPKATQNIVKKNVERIMK